MVICEMGEGCRICLGEFEQGETRYAVEIDADTLYEILDPCHKKCAEEYIKKNRK